MDTTKLERVNQYTRTVAKARGMKPTTNLLNYVVEMMPELLNGKNLQLTEKFAIKKLVIAYRPGGVNAMATGPAKVVAEYTAKVVAEDAAANQRVYDDDGSDIVNLGPEFTGTVTDIFADDESQCRRGKFTMPDGEVVPVWQCAGMPDNYWETNRNQAAANAEPDVTGPDAPAIDPDFCGQCLTHYGQHRETCPTLHITNWHSADQRRSALTHFSPRDLLSAALNAMIRNMPTTTQLYADGSTVELPIGVRIDRAAVALTEMLNEVAGTKKIAEKIEF